MRVSPGESITRAKLLETATATIRNAHSFTRRDSLSNWTRLLKISRTLDSIRWMSLMVLTTKEQLLDTEPRPIIRWRRSLPFQPVAAISRWPVARRHKVNDKHLLSPNLAARDSRVLNLMGKIMTYCIRSCPPMKAPGWKLAITVIVSGRAYQRAGGPTAMVTGFGPIGVGIGTRTSILGGQPITMDGGSI